MLLLRYRARTLRVRFDCVEHERLLFGLPGRRPGTFDVLEVVLWSWPVRLHGDVCDPSKTLFVIIYFYNFRATVSQGTTLLANRLP